MRTVHKFLVPPFSPSEESLPVMPAHPQARVVLVDADPRTGSPAVWLEVITEHGNEPAGRVMRFFGTGHDIPPGWQHVGSTIIDGYVWHVYEQVQR